MTMILLKNSSDQMLMTQRVKQPFIERWTLPHGKIHLDDERISQSASRELNEKTGLLIKNLDHIGDCYMRVRADDMLISSIFAHVFTKTINVNLPRDDLIWTDAEQQKNLKLAPGVNDIIWLAENSDGKFFAELNYDIDLS